MITCRTARGCGLLCLMWVLVGAASAQPAAAQETPGSRPGSRIDALGSESKPVSQWRLGAFAGGAQNSPVNPRLGTTPGRDHFFVGLQVQTTVLKIGASRLSYGMQLMPAIIIRGRTVPIYYTGYVDEEGMVPGPGTTYAYGFSPFAMELAAPIGSRLGIYGAAAGGLIFFAKPFPVPEAKSSNFTIEYGGGLLLRVGQKTWMQAGYKYHHLSNAYRELVNPGLDAHVVYVGYWRGIGK